MYSTALTARRCRTTTTTGTTVTVALVHNAPDVRLVSIAATRGSNVRVGGTTPVGDRVRQRAAPCCTSRAPSARASPPRNGVTVFDTRTWRSSVARHHRRFGPELDRGRPGPHLVYVTSAVFDPDGVRRQRDGDRRPDRQDRAARSRPGPARRPSPSTRRPARCTSPRQTGTDGGAAVAVIDGRSRQLLATIPIGPYEQLLRQPVRPGGQRRDQHGVRDRTRSTGTCTRSTATPMRSSARSASAGEPTALAVGSGGAVFVPVARDLVVIATVRCGVTGRVGSRTARCRGRLGPARRVRDDRPRRRRGDRSAARPTVVAHGVKPWGISVDPETGHASSSPTSSDGGVAAFRRGSAIRFT